MFDTALLEKARKAKSKEDLMTLAKENSITLSDEEAENYLGSLKLSLKQGELEDDELDDVSGGCNTTVNGKKYVVVSSGVKCFTGFYEEVQSVRNGYTSTSGGNALWFLNSSSGCCGRCVNLKFTNGGNLGYCSKS